ncbi:MAG TPA: hypothetical protein VN824_04325, partial [Puia sp.]|nr:hypothetical protein [Puia sp.]
DIQAYVDQLNAGMQKSLAKKKQRRLKRQLKEEPWGVLAIVIVVILCVIGYVVIRKFLLHSAP